MKQRLTRELDEPRGSTDFAQLSQRMLPGTDVTIGTPLLHVLEQEYQTVLAERAAQRLQPRRTS